MHPHFLTPLSFTHSTRLTSLFLFSSKHQNSPRTIHSPLPCFVSFLDSDVHHSHLLRGLPIPLCLRIAPLPSSSLHPFLCFVFQSTSRHNLNSYCVFVFVWGGTFSEVKWMIGWSHLLKKKKRGLGVVLDSLVDWCKSKNCYWFMTKSPEIESKY